MTHTVELMEASVPVNPLLDSTGVAWVVVGSVITGIMTLLIILATHLFQEDEASSRRRRRGSLPIVASTEEEARRRIRKFVLPERCIEVEGGVQEQNADGVQSSGSGLGKLLMTGLGMQTRPSKVDVPSWRYVASKDRHRARAGRTPLLVFVNVKSGGQQGVNVLRALRHIFPNEHQVVDLSSTSNPIAALYNFAEVPRFRVLCCGGDGTVASVLRMLDEVSRSRRLLYKPPIGILPLGTGNDLARVLGWGGGYEGGDLVSWLEAVAEAEVTLLDRWQVSMAPQPTGRSSPDEPEHCVRLVAWAGEAGRRGARSLTRVSPRCR